MEFYPSCGVLLQIEPARSGRKLRFFCLTCPYVCPVGNKIVKKYRLEPIFSGADAMKFAPKTGITGRLPNHSNFLHIFYFT